MQTRNYYIRYLRYISVVTLLLALPFVKAYGDNADSLKKVIQSGKDNLAKANAYVQLSEIMYVSNIDSVIPLCNTAIKIIDTSRLDSSKTTQAIVADIKAHALNNIGSVFYSKGDLPKAIDYYLEGLRLREKTSDKMGLAESYNNLGVMYKNQGNNATALDYYLKSLKFYTDAHNREGRANTIGNIGVLYSAQNKNDTALAYFFKGLALEDSIGDKAGIAKMMNDIGIIYQKQNKFSDALNYCLKSLDVFTKLDDKEDIAHTLYIIAQIEYDNNDYAKASEYGSKALQYSQDIGFPSDVMNAAKLMFEIYNEQKKWPEALKMHILYSAMHDSVTSEENRKEVIQKEFKYEYGKKEAAMQLAQEKKDLIAEAESKRQKIAIMFALIIAVAAASIAVVIFRSLKTTRKQKLVIEEQKSLVEQKNKDILDSITYAKRLQDAILPPISLIKQYLPESFILYKPKDIIAGDFYWMQPVADKVFIAACDCTGHGVPGAMVSVVCSNALNRAVKEFNITDPGKILDKTRELVIETFQKSGADVRDGMDISLCSLKQANGEISLQWAGANAPLWQVRNNEIDEIVADKQPIGQQEGQKQFTTYSASLKKGDMLYMFSDGYKDQFGGPDGKKFKAKLFRELVKSIASHSMDTQKSELDRSFEEWKGNNVQTDDVCVIGVRV